VRYGLVVVLGLVGCATRADLVRQDREVRGLLREQRKQMQSVQREIERLRADMEEGGARPGGSSGPTTDDRLTALEQRLANLERGAGTVTPAPPLAEGEEPFPEETTATTLPPVASRPPVAAPEEDPWRREIAREQAAAGSVDVPERAEYLGLLDGVASKDCPRSVPQLNSFAAKHKESALADNALYWAGRCYAVRGDQNQAITKFYDVVTKYPKSDKAPAALWAQGNLFVDMGDSPDARLAFSKLIRDYPASEEAARARKKLSELEN
jgi:tol-pal system protein YbgF